MFNAQERQLKRALSQAIWERMKANGDIYLSKYSGWYSVRDEAYFGEDELTEGPNGDKLAPSGAPAEWVEEESYFFRLSAYSEKLLALYQARPEFITPEKYRNEIVAFVKRGLEDLSISRTTFDLGVPVPGDPRHVMYVWVDALTNYITATGFPDGGPRAGFWPAVHMIGKDITRFQAIYWPAILMSAGVEVPRQIVVHGFLFNRGEKMSKSVGNVVDPLALIERYGVDQLRYFFLREVPFGQDGNYSHEAIVQRINADLANDLGNLAQRSLSMVAKSCDGVVPDWGGANFSSEDDLESVGLADGLAALARQHMKTYALHLYLTAVFDLIAKANRYFAAQEPWRLAKSDPARMRLVLYVTIETLRIAAIVLRPVMPAAMAKLLDLLAVPADKRDFAALVGAGPGLAGVNRLTPGAPLLHAPQPIFPRFVEAEAGRLMRLIDAAIAISTSSDFADEIEAVVVRAKVAGVERMITISTRIAHGDRLVALAERFPSVFFSIGTHPHQAAGEEPGDGPCGDPCAFARHPKCVAIGEAGLDYHYNYAPRDVAAKVFRAQIAAARELALPLVIHSRDADEDMAAILKDEMGKGPFAAVLHCFTSGSALAETGLALGLYISFSGVLTFKNSQSLREIARAAPLDRVLVETDAPYLAPVPHRGRRNEPAFVVETGRVLASVKGLSEEAVAEATRANTMRLFGKMATAEIAA